MKKYVFVGNRFHVLDVLTEHGINPVKILATKNSHLEEKLKKTAVSFVPLESKIQLCDILSSIEFDYLISNGCPYILPVSSLKKAHQVFINVHPSFLPDLKGINPINGAIFFDRSAGASCHLMDDGIDTGALISRVEIPLTSEVDLRLLYQLSFMAEKDVFLDALKRNFAPAEKNNCFPINNLSSYYTRKEKDRIIDFREDIKKIVRRIRAFGIVSQAAYFIFEGSVFHVLDAQIITNPYLLSKIENYTELEMVFIYNDVIVFKKEKAFLKLTGIIGDMSKFKVGEILASGKPDR